MRGFLDSESTKRAQLHDSGELRVDLLQAIERVIERENRHLVRRGHFFRIVNRHAPNTLSSFPRMVTARVIDQNPAHNLRGHAKEMRPVLPVDPALVDHAEIHLVNQCGRLQGVAGPFRPELARGDAAELRVDERLQFIERRTIAAAPVSEEHRDVV